MRRSKQDYSAKFLTHTAHPGKVERVSAPALLHNLPVIRPVRLLPPCVVRCCVRVTACRPGSALTARGRLRLRCASSSWESSREGVSRPQSVIMSASRSILFPTGQVTGAGEPTTVRRSRGTLKEIGEKQEGRTVLEGQPSASMVEGSGLCFASLSTVPVTGWRGLAERQQVSR